MADAPQVAYAGAYPEVHNETPPSKHHEVYNDTVPSKHHGPPSQDIRAYHHPEENSIQKLRRTILGMRRRNFWILLAIALVIVAATIGGSVGGSMAVRNSSSVQAPSSTAQPQSVTPASSSSSSATSTPATPSIYVPPASITNINMTCPIGVINTINSDRYVCTEKSQSDGGADLIGFSAFSLQQCVDSCSQANKWLSTKCKGVRLEANPSTRDVGYQGVNCWLKDSSKTKLWDSGIMAVML